MSKGIIIYIGGFELPDKNAAAHRVLNNAKALRKLGYAVIFIGIDKSLGKYEKIEFTKKNIEGFECYSVPYPKTIRQWFKYISSIRAELAIVKKQEYIKAIITYNYYAIRLAKMKLYTDNRNIKLIGDCTEWYDFSGEYNLRSLIQSFDSFFRMRILHKKLDGLIVISNYLADYYVNNKNVICVPPLVDLNDSKWCIDQNTINNDYTIKLVYSGSPGKKKDKLNEVISALSKIKKNNDKNKIIFYVVGISKDEYLSIYPEHLEILKQIDDKVKFIGRISHLESLKYIKNAHFSIFFRNVTRLTMAGFPTKFVESISCGTPVITTRTSDLKDFLIEGETGFFIDTSKNSVENILKIILNLDKNKIENMKKKCKEIKSFYYEEYLDLFEKLIES